MHKIKFLLIKVLRIVAISEILWTELPYLRMTEWGVFSVI